MASVIARYVAALTLAAEIAIHVLLAPDHLEEMPYIGVSFVIASVLCLAALIAVLAAPTDARGWLFGAALCVGMGVVFVISRTWGLPGYHEEWTSDSSLGLWSLLPEATFVACAAVAHRGRPARPSRACVPSCPRPSPVVRAARCR